jgi:cyanophycin synthetase
VPKEVDAIKHAMSLARPGTFITALSDVVDNAIETVQDYQEQERNGLFNV